MSKKSVKLESGTTFPDLFYSQTIGKNKEDAQPYEQIKSLRAALVSLSKEVIKMQADLAEKQESLREEIKEFKRDVGNDKIRAIEIIGIFIALFTFTSLEMSVFKNIDSGWKIFSLSFVLFSGLLFFAWLIFLIVEKWLNNDKDKKTESKEYFFPLLAVLFLIIGGVLWWFSSSENETLKRQAGIDKKINSIQDQVNKIGVCQEVKP